MIRVERVGEPEHFDERVRQPGLSELAVLTGNAGWVDRRGPKRKQLVVRGEPVTRVEDIPVDKLPDYWTRVLGDLLDGYRRMCAYSCFYIERVTGSKTIDHWIPKSRDPRLAYEWDNFRLACSIMNARKGVHMDLVDPFAVEDRWFELVFGDFSVIPGVTPSHPRYTAIKNTIDEFNLNNYECLKLREEYVQAYRDGDISLAYLERRAPFVTRELRRQGLLNDGAST